MKRDLASEPKKEEEEDVAAGNRKGPNSNKKRQVKLTLARSNYEDKEEVEILDGININYDDFGNIKTNQLLDSIKKLGYTVDGAMISYFNENKRVFVFIGCYPLDDSTLPNSEVSEPIQIKIRPKAKSIYGDFLLGTSNASISKGSRRTKERKIGDVIKKVSEWRKLYNGYEQEGQIYLNL